ncbi:MAG: ABC transporter permease [Bryobacteraceae bacterium]|nr:ABC transporter permease [Bryobacteraceae bacterium]
MRPKAYFAYLKFTLLLTSRDRVVLFFNYLMPLLFFIAFGEGLGAETSPGAMAQVVSMVIMFGVLGTGFFGGGLRATMDREAGILRRFKVAPITPAPILAASLITGWAVFMPSVFLFLALARWRYGWEGPTNLGSLLVIVTAGVLAFRSMGLIIASVVNSMQESQIIAQLLYMPLLLLSGATVPLHILPAWLQKVAQFLPATHLYLGTQGVLVRGESAWENRSALAAMLLATVAGFLVSLKLFRWEKEEKVRPAAKLWLAGVLLPFLLIGAWQFRDQQNERKMKILERQTRRSQSWLIRDARILRGDGGVVERGAVLVRNGRIVRVFEGPAPPPAELRAEAVEAGGRTLLPALIDSGSALERTLPGDEDEAELILSGYLYCGVGAVAASPDAQGALMALKRRVDEGELLGPEILPVPQAQVFSLTAVQAAAGDTSILSGDLAQQFYPAGWLQKLAIQASQRPMQPALLHAAQEQLRALWQQGTLPAPAGAAAGWLRLHGPALVHELGLWVEAGVPAAAALEAATGRAAARLGAQGRLGCVREGCEATLLLVDGNPLEDISALRRIHSVFARGERVARGELASQNKKDEK